MQISWKRRTTVVAVGLVSGALIGGVATATIVSNNTRTQHADGSVDNEPAPNYPRNAKGQTYGSALDARTPAEEPDLIEAIATNGRVGYVYRDELMGDVPTTLEEVRQHIANGQPSEPRVIPVYEDDGETQIGVFRMEDSPADRGHEVTQKP